MRQTYFHRITGICLTVNTLCFIAGIYSVLHGNSLTVIGCLLLLSVNLLLYCGFTHSCSKTESNRKLPEDLSEDLSEDLPYDIEEQEQIISLLESENQTCKTRIDELLALLDTKNQTPEPKPVPIEYSILPPFCVPQPVPVPGFLRNFMGEYEEVLQKNRLQYSVRCEQDELSALIPADILHLIFANIMDNSLKYLQANGMITITLSRLDSHLLIIWKDNGAGLASCDTAKLCSLNYQDSDKRGGTGLGLAQVQAAVLTYGGSITVKSSTDNGFALYIKLPLSV